MNCLLDTGTLYKLVKLSMVRFLKAYRKPNVGLKKGRMNQRYLIVISKLQEIQIIY